MDLVGDVYLIHDFQSLDSYHLYGREHLVYFPRTSANRIGGESTFVPSFTSEFGGATRRLDAAHNGKEALLPEIERKGVAFLAHHMNTVGAKGSRGPDGVPWTLDHMLLKAFRSPAILGLQFWNENSRNETPICSHQFCRDNNPMGEELGFERDESFDLFGYTPDELVDVALPLAEVRAGFTSGGPGGGLFELRPFSIPSGEWQTHGGDTERKLFHGAHDWDQLNLRGLDFQGNASLTWLPAGQPRRVFMGGGSDAHGDFNYRRAGYFLGAENANDTAIGKPRNLVFAGAPEGEILVSAEPPIQTRRVTSSRTQPPITEPPVTEPPIEPPTTEPPITRPPITDPPVTEPPTEPPSDPTKPPIIRPPIGPTPIRAHSQEQIIRALQNGRFSVTDGPAIRIAIDMNNNNQIDDADIQMGSVYEFKKIPAPRIPALGDGQRIKILTECISTPEFGPLEKIDVYVGAHPNPPGRGSPPLAPRVYAATFNGVHYAWGNGEPAFSYISPRGSWHSQAFDGTWRDDTLQTKPAENQYSLTTVTVIDLDYYEVGRGVTADRFFVRAFVSSRGDEMRYGFSNPIWLLRSELTTQLAPDVPETPAPAPPAVQAGLDENGRTVIHFIGALQYSPSLGAPFQDINPGQNPLVLTNTSGQGFYRSRR
jgi:hypothetical protein